MVLLLNDSILKDNKNSRQHQYDICYHFLISSQVEKYAFNIVEKGTRVNEEVEVDEDEQTEVIRVPKHNDVDAVELLNDFNAVIYKPIQLSVIIKITWESDQYGGFIYMSHFPKSTVDFDIFNMKFCHFTSNETTVAV